MRAVKRTGLAMLASLALGTGALIATPAYAATVDAVIDGITYEADNTDVAAGASATEFDGSSTTVTIPDSVEIDGTQYDVVEIGTSAFVTKNASGVITRGDITEVAIGDNVRAIGLQAFMNNRIDSLTLGASLKVIRGSAFMGNSLTQVAIPATVTNIAPAAFAENQALASAVFTGPAPAVRDASAGPSNATFGTVSPDFMISFPEQYSDDNVADGYTTPVWQGYPAKAADDDVPDSSLSITKTVEASFVRVYDWNVEKTGAIGTIAVDGDLASADVDFTVTATPNGYRDAYHVLRGTITVVNEGTEAQNVDVIDVPVVGTSASCDVRDSAYVPAQGVQIAAAQSVTFDYYCNLDGTPEDGTNTATVTWGDDESASATVDVVFTQRDTSFGTITIGDDHADPDGPFAELGTAEWNSDHMPTEFTYTVTADGLPVGECTSLTNTAAIYEMERSTEAVVEICPEAAVVVPDPEPTPEPEPDATPMAAPQPAGLATTGADLDGGAIAKAALLLLVGGVLLSVRRRNRSNGVQQP